MSTAKEESLPIICMVCTPVRGSVFHALAFCALSRVRIVIVLRYFLRLGISHPFLTKRLPLHAANAGLDGHLGQPEGSRYLEDEEHHSYGGGCD